MYDRAAVTHLKLFVCVSHYIADTHCLTCVCLHECMVLTYVLVCRTVREPEFLIRIWKHQLVLYGRQGPREMVRCAGVCKV